METLIQIFKKLVKNHDLTDKVLLVGKKPYNEIPEFLAAADICILPAYRDEEIMQDIVPIKIYEYMAMNKPSNNNQASRVMMEFGEENGISYVNEASEVPKAALKIDVQVEGYKARKYAENCDWNEITDEFEEILLNIC